MAWQKQKLSRMGANDFSVEVEKLDGLGNHLGDLAAWFAAMGSLADTSRAQASADSPLSRGALSSFGTTMMDALRTTANQLQEDRMKLARVAEKYRTVDENTARSADTISAGIDMDSRMPQLSVRQSQVTRGILEGLTGLDDVIVPAARTYTGASDRVQQSLRSDANSIERTANRTADGIEKIDPIAGAGVRIVGSVSAEVLRAADGALESAEDLVRGAAEWAEDVAARADRVLGRPTGAQR
jgi:hypothetical protein